MCITNLDDALNAASAKVSTQFAHRLLLAESPLPHEEHVAKLWQSLPSNTMLPLLDGGTCRLLYSGLRGGSAGPDIRDAILLFTDDNVQRVGAVEFHVRTSDWFTHGHHTDSRYNSVLLHVVLLHDSSNPTLCQNGRIVPTCSLYDIPIALNISSKSEKYTIWPCHDVVRNLSRSERDALLHRAGLLRFELKTHAFVEQLHGIEENGGDTEGCDKSYPYNNYLVVALAEGLAYGRDRAFFRAAAQRLLGLHNATLPEPLGRTPAPSPLDAQRLHVLHTFVAQKQELWQHLRKMLMDLSNEDVLSTLQSHFSRFGLGLARTDILLCNVVFPFAAAVALLEHDSVLAKQAQQLYETHPGLSSNAITRMMSAQLRLEQEPRGSCRQQGLHYIYQQTCQAKECASCMMGRRII